ncbi:tetratricopeptide repeat protein [Nocardiopsis kunsanensis]|nr:tetratricopeptide repeat protein [Nocardiopsis kunsanensis]
MLPHDSDRNRVTSDQVSGTVVQIGSVQGHVHTGTAHLPTPRQLPGGPRLFADREDAVRRLHELHEAAAPAVVLHGTGGVGKTALATHFLSSVADTFTDGVLHCDLLGFSGDAPADPGDVLDRFLRDLGAAPEHIPRDLAGRVAAFRTRTHGRRLGLLLDNAVSAAQVRPLLPGEGDHLVLVTTRLHLNGLRLDGAEFLELGPLDGSGTAELVRRILSDDRPRDEPDSLHALTGLCAGLPLAVCAAVSGLTVRRHQPLSRLVERLSRARHRLSAFGAETEMSVEAVLTESYRWLSPDAQRMYRLLGLSPGRDLTPEAAGALAGLSEEETEELLTELLTVSLLEEGAGGRLRQHDLTRLHARARAEDEGTEQEREEALDQVLEHYLTTAAAADQVLNPGRWHLAPVFDRLSASSFTTRADALAWSETELETLRSCVRFTHTSGRHESCWQLCEALRNLFILRKHYAVWEECYTTGLASAKALDSPTAQANMLGSLAGLHLALGSPEKAADLQSQAHELWRSAGHVRGQASASEGLGVCDLTRGRPEQARIHFTEYLALHEEIGDLRGTTLGHRRLGEASRDCRDFTTAVAHFTSALEGLPADIEPYQRMRTLIGLSDTHIRRGHLGSSGPLLEEALSLSFATGASGEEANVRSQLAEVALGRGAVREARAHLTQALALRSALRDPRAEETRHRLSGLSEAPPP